MEVSSLGRKQARLVSTLVRGDNGRQIPLCGSQRLRLKQCADSSVKSPARDGPHAQCGRRGEGGGELLGNLGSCIAAASPIKVYTRILLSLLLIVLLLRERERERELSECRRPFIWPSALFESDDNERVTPVTLLWRQFHGAP